MATCASNDGCVRGGGDGSHGLGKFCCSLEYWLLLTLVDECIDLCNEFGGGGGENHLHGHIVETQGCGVLLNRLFQPLNRLLKKCYKYA